MPHKRRPVKFLLAALLALGGAALARAQTAPAGDVTGWWMIPNGKAGVLIAPCGGGQLCGRLDWLKTPLNAQGQPKTDLHNGNAALQSRYLCGLQILGDFTPRDDGAWGGGWIYDPESGNTYSSNMHLDGDGKLHVRGFIGISLLGRSMVLTRPATPPTPCVVPPAR